MTVKEKARKNFNEQEHQRKRECESNIRKLKIARTSKHKQSIDTVQAKQIEQINGKILTHSMQHHQPVNHQ